MSKLILPEHLKTELVIPMQFINKIPEQILRHTSWLLANAVANRNGSDADKALIQLMMEVDIAGKKINAENDAKEAKRKEKKRDKRVK